MTVFFLTLAIFLLIVVAMAVGVIFRRPCLRGSCGGPDVLDASGESLTCSTCPNRDKNRAEEAGGGGGLPVVS